MPIARAADPYWLYVLRCGDGSLYAGITRHVARRLAMHVAGKGARYTRGRGPLTVVARARCADRSSALRVELAFKRRTRLDKEAIVGRPRGLARFVRGCVIARDAG